MADEKRYSYFSHKECEYYPCHKNADPENFNCLFCYCPLYALGEGCGGNFCFTEQGVKDCSNCLIPHEKGGFIYITDNFPKIIEMMKRDAEGKK